MAHSRAVCGVNTMVLLNTSMMKRMLLLVRSLVLETTVKSQLWLYPSSTAIHAAMLPLLMPLIVHSV